VLTKTNDDYFGVFTATSEGTAQLLIDTTVCVRPTSNGECILADVIVTRDPPPVTSTIPHVPGTTSIVH
jgi:hypothetical protein